MFQFHSGLVLLAIVSLPPSPMFFSELYGFGAMVDAAQKSHHLLAMTGAVGLAVLLLPSSMAFLRSVA